MNLIYLLLFLSIFLFGHNHQDNLTYFDFLFRINFHLYIVHFLDNLHFLSLLVDLFHNHLRRFLPFVPHFHHNRYFPQFLRFHRFLYLLLIYGIRLFFRLLLCEYHLRYFHNAFLL